MASNQSLIEHLTELRNRLIKALGSVFVVFLALVAWANDIYYMVSKPLQDVLPEGATMIATDVTANLFAPFKLTLMVSFIIAIPVVLYQIWAFVAPGLYRNEKKLVAPLLLSSTLLFYSGIAFAYFVVFPVIFVFLTALAPEGVIVAPDITFYLDLVLKLFFAFGVCFEIPIAIVLLCWTGVTTPEQLRSKRAYVIVGAFVVGMLLTPPDIISQTMLAIPMWFLFEIGIVVGSFYKKNHKQQELT